MKGGNGATSGSVVTLSPKANPKVAQVAEFAKGELLLPIPYSLFPTPYSLFNLPSVVNLGNF